MTQVIIKENKPVNETVINDLGDGVYIGTLPTVGVKVLLIKAYGRCCSVDISSDMGDLEESQSFRSWAEGGSDSKSCRFTNYKKINITKIEGDEISE